MRTGRATKKIVRLVARFFAHLIVQNVNKLNREKSERLRYPLSSSVCMFNLHQVGASAEVRVLELRQEVIAKTSSSENKQG